MNWFKDLKIKNKLIGSFVLICVFTAIVGILGVTNMKTLNQSSDEIYQKVNVPSLKLEELKTSLQEVRAYQLIAIYEKNQEAYETNNNTITELVQQTNSILEEYEATIDNDEIRTLYDNLVEQLTAYREARTENLNLVKEGKYDEAYQTMGKVTEARTKADEAMNLLIEKNDAIAQQILQQNEKEYNMQRAVMIAVIIITVIVAFGLGYVVSNIISKPILKIKDAADKLAMGDVDLKISEKSRDEIGELSQSMEQMIANIKEQAQVAERIAAGDLTVNVSVHSDKDLLGKKLSEMIYNNNEILAGISTAAEQVAVGARQVSDSSMALSQGATEQASSVQQLTASIEEIASQTELNAQNAEKANSMAESAKANAVTGNEQMKEMLSAMEEISDSATKISKIIKVIDDIAFQTNMLALNAAVEAARAGQHGKGFAVVAEEVKNLAARSASAAKETTEMIEESIKKSEAGTKIAQQTAGALEKIVMEVEKAAAFVKDIAVASNEQSMGINQINQGIMQVSQVVQSNSATSEESAAASEELSSQAILMKETVSKFKLKGTQKSYMYGQDEVSPEVLKLLEKSNDRTSSYYENDSVMDNGFGKKAQITLNDSEFGKY